MTKLAENNPQGTANIANDRVLAPCTFLFTGMSGNVMFKMPINADNREIAITYFETEHPDLKWYMTEKVVYGC